MRVSAWSSNFDSIGFIVSEILLFYAVKFLLEIAYLRRACAESRVSLLPG